MVRFLMKTLILSYINKLNFIKIEVLQMKDMRLEKSLFIKMAILRTNHF